MAGERPDQDGIQELHDIDERYANALFFKGHGGNMTAAQEAEALDERGTFYTAHTP